MVIFIARLSYYKGNYIIVETDYSWTLYQFMIMPPFMGRRDGGGLGFLEPKESGWKWELHSRLRSQPRFKWVFKLIGPFLEEGLAQKKQELVELPTATVTQHAEPSYLGPHLVDAGAVRFCEGAQLPVLLVHAAWDTPLTRPASTRAGASGQCPAPERTQQWLSPIRREAGLWRVSEWQALKAR